MVPQQLQQDYYTVPASQSHLEQIISPENQFQFSGNFFNPEEIFQLDHPVKTHQLDRNSDNCNFPKSPQTVLDLESGSIHQNYAMKQEYCEIREINRYDMSDDNHSLTSGSSAFDETLYYNMDALNCNSSYTQTAIQGTTEINNNFYYADASFDGQFTSNNNTILCNKNTNNYTSELINCNNQNNSYTNSYPAQEYSANFENGYYEGTFYNYEQCAF